MQKIKLLLEVLNIVDTENLINKGLVFFRLEYKKIQNKYPGDDEYYNLFYRGLLNGLNLKESYDYSINIINREMMLINQARSIGIVRNGFFYEGVFL